MMTHGNRFTTEESVMGDVTAVAALTRRTHEPIVVHPNTVYSDIHSIFSGGKG